MKKLLYILILTFILIPPIYALAQWPVTVGGKELIFTESSSSPGTWTSPNGYTIIDQGAIDPKNDGNVTITSPNGTIATLEGLDDFDLGVTAIGDAIVKMDNTNPTTNTTQPDDNAGVDKAVYDNAIADGKTPAEASALAGGYEPPSNTLQYAAPTRVETENGVTTAYYKNDDGSYTTAPATVETENGVTTTYIKQPDGSYATIPGDATKANINAAAKNGTPDNSTNNILGEKNSDLRTGNVDMSTIPKIIISVINVLLGVAGTVAVVALIYYAVQMQLASGITGDSSKVDNAKKGMTGALIGFVVAILAWFIVIRFVEILSSVS